MQKTYDTLKDIKSTGLPIFLIEQNALLALNFSERGYVIETGTIAMEGRGADLLKNEKIKEFYLGG